LKQTGSQALREGCDDLRGMTTITPAVLPAYLAIGDWCGAQVPVA
jgi:hypothetical protein